MSTKPTHDLIQRYVDAWNSHDVPAIEAFFTDDCCYEDTAFGLVNTGKQELRTFLEEAFSTVPNMHFDVQGVVLGDDGVGVGWAWTMSGNPVDGKNPDAAPQGPPAVSQGASLTYFRDGLIVRNLDYYDSKPFLGI
ncbi:nuclear transport factor 2 family protein [Rhodococcus koreensis]